MVCWRSIGPSTRTVSVPARNTCEAIHLQPDPESRHPKKCMRRRILIGGAGVTGLAGIGTFVYRAAPTFWKQYAKEIRRPIGHPALKPNPAKWPDTGLHATWLGHSTVLLKVDGTTILTDPVFSDRVGLNFGPVTLGLKRLVAPAAPFNHLPKVDLVVLSHAHMDHFDIPSLRLLENPHTSVVTASRTSDLLRP